MKIDCTNRHSFLAKCPNCDELAKVQAISDGEPEEDGFCWDWEGVCPSCGKGGYVKDGLFTF